MKLFHRSYDGGPDSGVTGYWLIEWKRLFSICLLKFNPNHRENFHSHAFNALTWWIKGEATEELLDGSLLSWKPSIMPKFTPKHNIHKIHVTDTVYALSIRGPWDRTWIEVTPEGNTITLSKGRKRI